jgi:hypothetical protein
LTSLRRNVCEEDINNIYESPAVSSFGSKIAGKMVQSIAEKLQ